MGWDHRIENDRLVTARDLARLLSVKESTLLAWAAAGKIPMRRVGRFVRFSLRETERWLDRQARQSVRRDGLSWCPACGGPVIEGRCVVCEGTSRTAEGPA